MARLACLLVVLILLGLRLPAGEPPVNAPALVEARAALLLDRQTGMVLWEKNADARLPMASTTKIMTAMIILDHGADKLNQTVTVSEHAFATGGSSVFAAGDLVSLGDLLKAALIRSSNEATVAAAEYLAGDEATFVRWMNEKAQMLGLTNTHFTNPHGLVRDITIPHYSSARDLAVMTRYALTDYPQIRHIVIMGRKPFKAKVLNREHPIVETHNRILGKPVPGIPNSRVDGVKTGYVAISGKCFVASATQNDWQLIAVVLDSPNTFKEAQTLLHYGFSRYQWTKFAEVGQEAATTPVARGAEERLSVGAQTMLGAPTLRPGFGGGLGEDTVEFRGGTVRAPVRRGAVVGTLQLQHNGAVISETPAVALQDISLAWWMKAAKGIGYTVLTLLILFVMGTIHGKIAKARRRRRRQFEARRRRADYGGARDS